MCSASYAPGDFVTCEYLHLDTAHREPETQEPDVDGCYRFVVHGKPRPALVVMRLTALTGRPKYLILKVTTSKTAYPLAYLDGQQQSYLEVAPEPYPDNLLPYKKDWPSLPRSYLDSVTKAVERILLSGKTPARGSNRVETAITGMTTKR